MAMHFWFAKGNSGIYRKMGYFTDQDGIMNRYIREADRWKSHLESTKSSILQSCKGKKHGKIGILGSGWLLDVPIDELALQFKEVWLFDIKHPLPIRRKTEKLGNVRLVETDISGFATAVYAASKNKTVSVNSLKPKFDFDLRDFDMVVSCNILNQLDIILIDFLKRASKIDHTIEMEIRKFVQEAHVSLLPPRKSLLISDVEELSIDKQGLVTKRKSLVYTDKIITEGAKQWTWQFDNCYAYHVTCNTWFNVISVEI